MDYSGLEFALGQEHREHRRPIIVKERLVEYEGIKPSSKRKVGKTRGAGVYMGMES